MISEAVKLSFVGKLRFGAGVIRWFAQNGRVLLTLILTILVWEFAVWLFDFPRYLLPAPSAIVEEFSERWRSVVPHAAATLWIIVVGYLIAAAVSIPLALIIAFSRFLETTLYPIVVLFQIVPKIAVAPLFLIWFGFGIAPKLLLVFLISFFPITVSSIAGFKSVSPEIMDFSRSTGADGWTIFRKIRLPAALPSIFVGLKVASAFAATAAVVAEFVASDKGLGFLLLQYNGDLDTAMAFAAIVILSSIGLGLYYIVEWLERLIIPWRVPTAGQNVEAGVG